MGLVFVIAMALDEIFILASRKNPSIFLFEISNNLHNEHKEMCPWCKTGEIKLVNSEYGKFYGCSNYPNGCDFKRSFYHGRSIYFTV